MRVFRFLRAAAVFAVAISAISSAAAAQASSIPGALVFVGTDANIYYCAGNCANPKCITCPLSGAHVRADGSFLDAGYHPIVEQPRVAEYGWPTFSPDGKQIAYVSAARTKSGPSFAAWVYNLEKHTATQVFESHSERVIYFAWLADGQRLSFLISERTGLSLMLAEVKEGAPVRIVTTGMPLYFDWGPAPGTLAVHTMTPRKESSDHVWLMSLTPTNQQVDRVLSRGRSPFKTPCWSPDGKHLAYIASFQAESALEVADADGRNPRSIVSLPVGENSFEWAPDSKHIAYSTSIIAQEPIFHGVRLVDIEQAESRWLTKDPVAAYFISPDSRYLAYVGVPEEKPFYQWGIVDLKSGKLRTVANFIATAESATVYRFFDQLAVSHTIWAPDSSAFVFAGVRLLQEPETELRETPPPSVWVVPVNGEPRQIGAGVVGFFSPAPAR